MQPDDIEDRFQPDYSAEEMQSLGIPAALYQGQGPRLASLPSWKQEWLSPHDPDGWVQWYSRYSDGRRLPEEDARQIKRWLSFRARHGSAFSKNPTPRRGWALRNWAIDPAKLVAPTDSEDVTSMLQQYREKLVQRELEKEARCWKGYEPVPGKKPYSPDSCQPVGTKPDVKKELARRSANAESKTAGFVDTVKRVAPWVTRMNPLPSAPAAGFKMLDPVAEEATHLGRQALTNELSLGLAKRPFFHLQDRLVGGAGGAVAGGISDDQLRTHDGSWKDMAGRGLAVASGGWLGGKSLNAGMNVGRRYIAETAPLFGYNTADIAKTPLTQKLKDIYRFGIRGQQRTDADSYLADQLKDIASDLKSGELTRRGAQWETLRAKDFAYAARARAELLRRYMGVHADDVTKDFFIRKPDNTYVYNPATVSKGTEAYGNLVGRQLNFKGLQDAANPPRYSWDVTDSPFRNVLGSHDMRATAPLVRNADGSGVGKYEVGDVWNFAIDPHENDIGGYLKGLMKTSPLKWRQYLNQPLSAATHESMLDVGDKTVGGRLKSVFLRQLMEKGFRHHSPVIRQPLTLSFADLAAKTPRTLELAPGATPPLIQQISDIAMT